MPEENGHELALIYATLRAMNKYRSLAAWQHAHELALLTLRSTTRGYRPESRALFEQLRRATISIEANIVEGYALGTPLQFRRHLRIALGSAAESECLIEIAREVSALSEPDLKRMASLIDGVLKTLFGLVRSFGQRPAPRSPLPAPGP